MIPSVHCFYVKMKMLADSQICISVSLIINYFCIKNLFSETREKQKNIAFRVTFRKKIEKWMPILILILILISVDTWLLISCFSDACAEQWLNFQLTTALYVYYISKYLSFKVNGSRYKPRGVTSYFSTGQNLLKKYWEKINIGTINWEKLFDWSAEHK